MRRNILLLCLVISSFIASHAQQPIRARHYPSLLWEISGNGLQKSSYLFGTMHVSSKIAFNLSDSFYIGIQQADIVAIENNPESWQSDMQLYNTNPYDQYNPFYSQNKFLYYNTLRFYKYEPRIAMLLNSNPSVINNLLYRSYENDGADFEEDTYLDMYIYQCGKKWGKQITGVEEYGRSLELMNEAYKDAAKETNKIDRSYDIDERFGMHRLQEAYRSGNLDWLDTISKVNSTSAAFDEKFLYVRNEIQAASIDSIIKTGQSLFVGVGAAHLPGQRGVIDLLKKQGYTLRPIMMTSRDSDYKNAIENIRVPISFTTQFAADSFFTVETPGPLYKNDENPQIEQYQYADMANGSYYMVSRLMTNAWLWNNSPDRVLVIVDSLLYENIPGRIMDKTWITRDGFDGIALTNRTRRGDVQRYQIFVTPFEIVTFKISGTGDYIEKGNEAETFFNSVRFRSYSQQKQKYSPSYGGFTATFPHNPYTGFDGSQLFDAIDSSNGNAYRIIRSNIRNLSFLEEDSFDLELMEESFLSSEFIQQTITKQQTSLQGYPALDGQYKDKAGMSIYARFLIQGPNYYTILARGKENTALQQFIQSFTVTANSYPQPHPYQDTALYFTVKTPVSPETKKKSIFGNNSYDFNNTGELPETEQLKQSVFRMQSFSNDSTGEAISVIFSTPSYYEAIDNKSVKELEEYFLNSKDSTMLVKQIKRDSTSELESLHYQIRTTGSTRQINAAIYILNKTQLYILMYLNDTISAPSSFITSFMNSFTPVKANYQSDSDINKAQLFFHDIVSSDSTIKQRALKGIGRVKIKKEDLPQFNHIINGLNWEEKNYIETKGLFFDKLSTIKDKEATNLLITQYRQVGDTIDFQHQILNALLRQKTAYGYEAFRRIVTTDPPILNLNDNMYQDYGGGYQNKFMSTLSDSLALSTTIFKHLLPLIDLDDYKPPVLQLLGNLLDSNLITPKIYKNYQKRFLLESKTLLKKQLAKEKQEQIEKAEALKNATATSLTDDYYYTQENNQLLLYSRILIPFWEKNKAVPGFFNELFTITEEKTKFNALAIALREKRTIPDTLLTFYAVKDNYRYPLYLLLKETQQLALFPEAYRNHVALAKSKLLTTANDKKIDSIEFISRLSAVNKQENGWIYFFRYRAKKDDLDWKIATVGIVPDNPALIDFENTPKAIIVSEQDLYNSLTRFTQTRINDYEPLQVQLERNKKRIINEQRKSALYFYSRGTETEVYDQYEEEEE